MLRLSYVVSLSVLRLGATTVEERVDPISPFNPHPQTIYTGTSCIEVELKMTFE